MRRYLTITVLAAATLATAGCAPSSGGGYYTTADDYAAIIDQSVRSLATTAFDGTVLAGVLNARQAVLDGVPEIGR